jgi:hypothetical protein
MALPRRPSPEELYLEKKRAELGALETQLAERELELHTMRGGMISFEAQYQAMVGAKYTELDEIQAKIAELMPPAPPTSEQPTEPAKPQAAGTARPRPRRRPPVALPKPKPQETTEKPPDFNPAETLKRLYRDVAKSLHPDLADSDESRAHRHQFMIRANQAYEAADEAALLAVFHDWEQAPESVKGDGTAADLVRVIRKIAWIEQRLFKIAEEIHQVQTSGLFGMKMMADEAAEFERDLMAEMTGRLDEDIAAAKEILARLEAAHPPKPAAEGERCDE